ncbi:MAG: hypothetical protein ACTIM4_15930 [Marinomonas sp.]
MKESTKIAYESKIDTMLLALGESREDVAKRFIFAPTEIQKFFKMAMEGKSKSSYSIYRQAMYFFLDGIGIDRNKYDITGFSASATRRGISMKKKSYPEDLRLRVLKKIKEQSKMSDVDKFIYLSTSPAGPLYWQSINGIFKHGSGDVE